MTAQEGNGGASEKRQVKDIVVYIAGLTLTRDKVFKTVLSEKYIRYPNRYSEFEYNQPNNIYGRCPKCHTWDLFYVLGEDDDGREQARCLNCEVVVYVDEIIRASLR